MEFSLLGLPADWREILDDEVEILEPNVPPHELARATGMIPEEFFVRLSLAIPPEILGSTEMR
jgi:alanine racemase